VGTSIGDIIGGMYAAYGALAALFARKMTGIGQKVDIALLDCQVAILENAVARYSSTGQVPGPLGLRHPLITPFEAFKTRDSYIIIACGNTHWFNRLCEIIGCPELISDPRFDNNAHRTDNVAELSRLLGEKLSQKTTDEWFAILEPAGIPCGPINSVDKLFTNPQLAARNMLVEVEQNGIGRVKVAGNPIKLSTVPAEDELPGAPAPQIGQHTAEVLINELGFTKAQAEEYIAQQSRVPQD
jgi:CoA:oxalate CoA-transferase